MRSERGLLSGLSIKKQFSPLQEGRAAVAIRAYLWPTFPRKPCKQTRTQHIKAALCPAGLMQATREREDHILVTITVHYRSQEVSLGATQTSRHPEEWREHLVEGLFPFCLLFLLQWRLEERVKHKITRFNFIVQLSGTRWQDQILGLMWV